MPTTAPSNFAATVINATTILLSWSPPVVPNGIIVSYQVNYSIFGQSEKFEEDLPSILSYEVSDLDEYTWYTFTISSSTRIGEGPSTTVSARTDIAGMSKILERTVSLCKIMSSYSYTYMIVSIHTCWVTRP